MWNISLSQIEKWMEKLEESETKRRVAIKTAIVSAALFVSYMSYNKLIRLFMVFYSLMLYFNILWCRPRMVNKNISFSFIFSRLGTYGMNTYTSWIRSHTTNSTLTPHGFQLRECYLFLLFFLLFFMFSLFLYFMLGR